MKIVLTKLERIALIIHDCQACNACLIIHNRKGFLESENMAKVYLEHLEVIIGRGVGNAEL